MELRWPDATMLESFCDALRRGWYPNTIDPESGPATLKAIEADADAVLASMVDLEAAGGPIELPDGSTGRRLPSYKMWMWDGEFCGSINFRWQPGTSELPAHVPGHIGYAVAEWKRGRGHATAAVGEVLTDAAARGLECVELTTDADNIASHRVIEKNGGNIVERFDSHPIMGPQPGLRWRIDLT